MVYYMNSNPFLVFYISFQKDSSYFVSTFPREKFPNSESLGKYLNKIVYVLQGSYKDIILFVEVVNS